MKKSFIEKVLKLGIVDTRKYRYIRKETKTSYQVQRLPLELLDTTKALNEWEVVYNV